MTDPEIVDPAEQEDSAGATLNLARANEVLPGQIHLLPVASRPFFPGQAVPLMMDAEHWSATIEAVTDTEHKILGVILVGSENSEDAGVSDFYSVGTACRVHRVHQQDGHLQVLVECLQRFELTDWLHTQVPFHAQVSYLPEPAGPPDEQVRAYAMAVINTIKELLPLNPLYVEELRMFLDRFGPDDPSHLADFAASLTTSSKEQLQGVLEAVPLLPRMEKVLVLLNNERELAKAQQKIKRSVEERMQKQQREFLLKEQLKEIQKELGIAKDDRTAELDKFKERIAKLTLTDEAQKRVDEEMEKMAILETGSPEYSVTRNYLDWISLLPWGKHSKDKLDLKRARRVLDRDHFGLDDVKQRILEFLAVGIHKGEIAGSIILLVGPPGVGKTSIGRSIADALGRRFYRFSVGGIRDEAEIKGHRRTYIGAMPGKFVQAMKDAGTANPVIMLDEIDKIGASYQGDPASALLEVLDPAQNHEFLDHYLDVRFDLSNVLFICTANQLDTVPRPLLDRMEVISLAGYILEEKLEIARRYLVPKALESHGLRRGQMSFTRSALREIIDGYAREPGVRGLEHRIQRIMRKGVGRIVRGEVEKVRVDKADVGEILGRRLFSDQDRRGRRVPGVVTGLAWTSLGGTTLDVEANAVGTGRSRFKQTGQLGSVMVESAEIAYSYVRALLDDDPKIKKFFEESAIHLHVPAGATPKDGPSAGITMAAALYSLARSRPVRPGLAMTGELTLTGKVMPIGGVKEKTIAAKRAKIHRLIFPEQNRRDFEELPEGVRKGLTVHFVESFPEVIEICFPSRGRTRPGAKRKAGG